MEKHSLACQLNKQFIHRNLFLYDVAMFVLLQSERSLILADESPDMLEPTPQSHKEETTEENTEAVRVYTAGVHSR